MYFTLEELGLVDCPPEDTFDNLTSLAAELLQVPVAHVSIADHANRRIYYKSQSGHPDELAQARELPMENTYCQHVALTGAPLIVKDAREHPLLIGTPALSADSPLAYLGIPVTVPGDKVIGGLCMMQPTVRKWTDAEIERARKLADCVSDLIRLKISNLVSEQLRHEQQVFSYAISHDLRSPATTLGMILDEVGQESSRLCAYNQMLVEKGKDAVARMGEQIEAVLGYAQTIGENTKLEQIGLSRLIGEILLDMESARDGADVRVDISASATVVGNPTQLRALFTNLISNALKFRKVDYQHRVEVESVCDVTGLCITVKDNGIGIEREYQARVFELFQRLNDRLDYEGTGIGLALCKQVARNHNIAIAVESDGTSGTVFSLRFPACSMTSVPV